MKIIQVKFKKQADYDKFEKEMLPEMRADINEPNGEMHSGMNLIETEDSIILEVLRLPENEES